MAKRSIPATRYLLAALLAGMMAFCCQIVAVFGPAWAILELNKPEMYIQNGVWYSRACSHDTGTCFMAPMESIHELFEGRSIKPHIVWESLQIITTVSLALSVCSLVMMALAQKRFRVNHPTCALIFSSAAVATLSYFTMLAAVILVTAAAPAIDSSWTEAWSRTVAAASLPPGVIAIILLMYVFSQTIFRPRFDDNGINPVGNNRMNTELPCVSASDVFPLPAYTVNDTNVVAEAEPPPAYTEIELSSQRIRDV